MRIRGVELQSASRLLLVGLIGGLLVAAAALPAAAVATLAMDQTSIAYDDLPDALKNPAISQASSLYANDGKTLITSFYDENRRDITLDQVPKVMQDAVVAAEDSRFYEHHGVDMFGVIRAMVANSSSERVQGASTLTMQYVRNVLKSDPSQSDEERQAATAVTPARKIQEIRYAMAIEERLSKQDILERYLNIAYFGSGAYGIEAASQIYFSKEPSQLTLAEAATLAGMLQSPESAADQAKVRRTYALNAMARAGMITPQQAADADTQPLVFKKSSVPNDCADSRAGWGFFCDYFVQWWQTRFSLSDLRRGGYKIVTTLDPKVQDSALQQVHTVYSDKSKFVAPMAIIQPGTGKVLALAVNRVYGDTYAQLVAGGGGLTGYQAGSTFKMFAMLAALEQGLPLNTGFDAPAQLVTDWKISAPGKNNCDGKWCVSNANPDWMDGQRTMWDGFGRSVNTYWVWLHQQIGAQRTVEMAKRLGIKTSDPGTGSFVLGTAPTFPLDLANAYATVAAEGKYCAPLPAASIVDGRGNPVTVQSDCKQVLDPDIARAATDAARCPVGQQGYYGQCNGGTAAAVDDIMGGRPVAGKTGSTDDGRTESFVAFTPAFAAAMIAANPTRAEDGVGNAAIGKVYPAVARTLAAASAGTPFANFGKPSEHIAFGDTRQLFANNPSPAPAPPAQPPARPKPSPPPGRRHHH